MGFYGFESLRIHWFIIILRYFEYSPIFSDWPILVYFGALKYWQYNGWSSTKGDAWWMAAWHPPLGSRSLSENMLKLQDAVVCSFFQMFALRHWENCTLCSFWHKLPTPAPLDSHFPKRSKPFRLFHSPRSSWSPAWCEWRSSSGTLPLFLGEVTRSFPVSPETEH